MRTWMGLAIGAMLAISLLGAFAVPARAVDFEIEYYDTSEAGLQPDADIESLTSTVEFGNVVIELVVYGDINTGSDYEYYIWAGDSQTGGSYPVVFTLLGGDGRLLYGTQDISNPQTISGDTLTFSFPLTYINSATKFDLMAEADYYGTTPFEIDEVGGDVWAGYDFDGADSISVPGTEYGYLFDSDNYVYRMTLTSGRQTTMSLDGPAGANFNMYLFNSDESQVWASEGTSADEEIIYNPLLGGTYYLAIDSIYGSGSYVLTIAVASISSGGFEKTTPDSVPWTSGDYAACGGYLDLGAVIDTMVEEMENEMPEGVDVSVSGSGGIGQYILVEYVGEDQGDYKFDYTCTIYADMTGSANVKSTDSEMSGTIKGSVSVTVELTYSGSLWLGYYENAAGTNGYWAAEKMTLNIVGALDADLNVDVDVSAEGMTVSGTIDASATVDLDLELTLESEPGIPFMPAEDKDISVEKTCTVTYDGDVKFDMVVNMDATGMLKTYLESGIDIPDPIHVDESASGAFTDTYALTYLASTNTATAPALINGGWAMIVNVDELGIPGTRATGFETTATYDPAKGMYTAYEPYFGPAEDMMSGLSLPGVGDIPDTSSLDMTLEPVSKEDAESFNDDPSAFLENEGVTMPGDSFPWLLVILGLVVVAVVVVLVIFLLMMQKKKGAKFHQHPEPYQAQQPYGQQPYQQYPPQQPPQEQYPPQQPPPQYPPQ